MRVKNITIASKSDEELFQEGKDVGEKTEHGGKARKHEGPRFKNLAATRKVLRKNRLKILKTVRKGRPSSIDELAKVLKRDVKNTFDDIQFLAGIGVIDVKKTKEGRERNTPHCGLSKNSSGDPGVAITYGKGGIQDVPLSLKK